MTGAAGQGQSEVTSVMSKQEQGPPTNELEWREELARAAFFIIYYQSSIPAKKRSISDGENLSSHPIFVSGLNSLQAQESGHTTEKSTLYYPNMTAISIIRCDSICRIVMSVNE